MLKHTFIIIALLSSSVFAQSKKADPRISMMESRFAKFKVEFTKACDAQVKGHKDLKSSASYCGCMIEKHHVFLLSKVQGNEKINVPKYLDDVLKLYKGQKVEQGEDNITVLDVDGEMAEECLAK